MTILKSQQGEELFKLLLNRINDDLDSGENVILVVPAQATLLIERGVFDALGKPGFFKLRIIRGQKLHEEILHECGYPGLTAINSIGRSMLLRRIAGEHRNEFSAFSGVYSDSGFIDLAGDFIVQLKQNNVSDEQLCELIESCPAGSLLRKKLLDMRIITKGYENALDGRFTDSEDLLDYITGCVKNSSLVRNSRIYFYGFYSFTKREYAYLSELARCSRGLCLALLSGNDAAFEITRKTESRLVELIPNTEIVSGNACGLFLETPAESRRLVRCANPFSQARTIAADIRRLVRERGYKYSDIAVLTAESSQMTGAIERVFSTLNIPVFKDEKRSILHTQAADAVMALLDIVCKNYETQDIIRLLKSGVFDFETDDVELFENYAKQYHIKAERFFVPLKYGRDKFEAFEKLEAIRKTSFEKLNLFTERMTECTNVNEKTSCLYDYLDKELKLPERLDSLSLLQTEEGFSDAAEESARVWDCICAIFDQITELMGDEALSVDEYADILKASFKDVKVGVLPQSEGKVQLGSIMRSFTDGKRAVYIAGFNDGYIPSDNQSTGILSDEELHAAAATGTILAKTSDAYTDEELFMISKALNSAKEYLWLGYCISDISGSDIKASTLLEEIKKNTGLTEEQDISAASDGVVFLEGKDFAMPEMAQSLRDVMNGKELLPIWKEVYNCVKDDASSINEALRFSNAKQSLGIELSRQLFARDGEFSFSPSRMDGFAACPFKHFVDYGLNPEIPGEFGMGGSEVGSVYHETLLRLCRKIDDWSTVDDAELERIIDDILKELSLTKLDGVMLSGKAEIYTSKRIRQVCLRFAKHMAKQIRESRIEKMYLETSFGRKGVFPALTINTSSGKVYVEGRIDRVDICPDGDGKYVRVIDYKSGNVKFNKSLIEKGLSLQLMVYLEGAMGEYSDAAKSGVYYFCIKDPKVAANLQDFPADEIAEDVLAKINKEYKLDGMDVDAEFTAQFTDTLTALCDRLTSGDISVEPKQIGSVYDSCEYCEFAGICLKDIE